MSRDKGSAFERQIARELHALTGITFRRDLEQVRAAERSDLLPSDPAFPFALELKRRATGHACEPAWQAQASRAAAAQGKAPAVIFKFDRLPVRVSIPLATVAPAAPANAWIEVTLDSLAFLAREIMAGKAMA